MIYKLRLGHEVADSISGIVVFMKTTQFDYKICKIMIVPESIAINYNIVIL